MALNKTLIDWVKNPDGTQGYTWNPITGCLNHLNGLCKGGNFPCYAYRLAHGRLKNLYLANKNIAPVCGEYYQRHYGEVSQNVVVKAMDDPFYPRFWPERLEIMKERFWQLLSCKDKLPKKLGIFPCDMGDLFGIGIPDEWTKLVLEAIRINAYDRFYLLTKQPQNLPQWSPFPDNCWVGVTATNYKMFANAIYHLGKIQAKVTYISLEPLLEHIPIIGRDFQFHRPDWLIIGAQTKPYKPPKIEWVQEIVEAADKAGTKVFLKENLDELLPESPLFRRSAFNLRQEFPQ